MSYLCNLCKHNTDYCAEVNGMGLNIACPRFEARKPSYSSATPKVTKNDNKRQTQTDAALHVFINKDFCEMMNYAVRYGLGRLSYAPSSIVTYITPLLPYINAVTLKVMYRDVTDYLQQCKLNENDCYGDIVQTWSRFAENLLHEMEQRGGSYENSY